MLDAYVFGLFTVPSSRSIPLAAILVEERMRGFARISRIKDPKPKTYVIVPVPAEIADNVTAIINYTAGQKGEAYGTSNEFHILLELGGKVVFVRDGVGSEQFNVTIETISGRIIPYRYTIGRGTAGLFKQFFEEHYAPV